MGISGFCGAPAFEERTVSSAQLSQKETQRYERLKKASNVLRAKLVAINDEMLTRGGSVEMPLFENLRADYQVSKEEREEVWKGRSGKNFDRFVIRKIGGMYSGHILHKGRQYVLTPLKSGVSMLYEMSLEFECGVGGSKKEHR
jgi:hypothetical protein